MAHHATSGRYFSESSVFGTSEPFAQPDPPTMPQPETDLAELAARFAAPTGPGLAPDLAIDLALQMVLHEIVEQACVSTAASGAAIALYHDGELVCRASHGATAPLLGSRLDSRAGLSGECLHTAQIQLCNDAQTDLRVDLDTCSQLGVRSVAVLPLSRARKISGIFEVSSPRPSAFGDGEIALLQAFADRILKNLDRAVELSAPMTAESPSPPMVMESPSAASNPAAGPQSVESDQLVESDRVTAATPWTEIITWALGIVVLACATWLGIRLFQHFTRQGAIQSTASSVQPSSASTHAAAIDSSSDNRATAQSQTGSSSSAVPSSMTSRDRTEAPPSTRTRPRAPEGSLLVYEKGREVFRLPPSSPEAELPGTSLKQSASIQSQNVLELPASTAESNLIHRVEPEYPEEARVAGIQGPVVLEVHIRADGSVKQCKIVSGEPVLASAAMTAVSQWRFKPHRVNGQPVEMQTTITLNFRLPS